MPIRLLPLYGTIALPSLTPYVLREHRAIGANTVLVCITEEDMLMRQDNIAKVISIAVRMGFRVYASAWGYGGLTGGEALSASTLHHQLTGQQRYLNATYTLGPSAEITASDQAITSSPAFQLKRMQQLVAEAGADTFFYDELKIERNVGGRGHKPSVSLGEFTDLAENARSLGLRNSLCVAVANEADEALLSRLVALDCVNELSFTRYYSPGHYDPSPSSYLGPIIAKLKTAVSTTKRDISLMGWAQAFDLGDRGDIIADVAKTWRQYGVDNLGVWGGFCVNDTPMLIPAAHSQHYIEIASVFGNPAPLEPDITMSQQLSAA